MEKISLLDFKGMTWRNSLWPQGFSYYATGVDIFGLNDNPKKFSYPGVIQGSVRTGQMSQAASPSAVTEIIQDFAYYETSASNGHYAFGRVNPGRIYRLMNNGGTDEWRYVSAITVSGNGNNLQVYNGDMYYATNTNLGVYNNATGNATFQAFIDTFTSPRPMKVFSGALFIGAGRYVAKYDGTTFSGTKLTLPSNYVVRSIEVYKDRLRISADDGAQSRLFTWDGVSQTYEEDTIIGDETVAPSLVTSNALLWAASNKGDAIPTTQIYVFDGKDLQPQILLPIQRSNDFAPPLGIAAYSNGILVAGSDTTPTNYEDGTAGLWFIGKDTDGNYHAVDLFPLDQLTQLATLGGIFTGGKLSPNSKALPLLAYLGFAGNNLMIGQDTTNYYTNRVRWQTLPIDAHDASTPKVWNYISCTIDPDVSATADVKILYRLDFDTNWTTLKTITTVAGATVKIPIRKKSTIIELRIELTNSQGNTTGTRFRALDLFCSKTNE